MALSAEAGWNQLPADWWFMLDAGHGVGIRSGEGQWIGTGLVLPLGPRIAWISMVLVAAAARRHGLGGALLADCFARAEAQGLIAGLDATELGRPVYLRHGFRDVWPLRRWRLDRLPARSAAPQGVATSHVRISDLQDIARFDAPRSGLQRRHVLAHLIARRPAMARLARRGDRITGFALARDGRLATHIGPVVADDGAIAIALIAAAMRAGVPPFMIDVPDAHDDVTRWLEQQRATAPRGFMRMLRGSHPDVETAQHVFALAGPELA